MNMFSPYKKKYQCMLICTYTNLLATVSDKFINSKLWILEIISWIYVSIIFSTFKNIISANLCAKGEQFQKTQVIS